METINIKKGEDGIKKVFSNLPEFSEKVYIAESYRWYVYPLEDDKDGNLCETYFYPIEPDSDPDLSLSYDENLYLKKVKEFYNVTRIIIPIYSDRLSGQEESWQKVIFVSSEEFIIFQEYLEKSPQGIITERKIVKSYLMNQSEFSNKIENELNRYIF